MNKSMSGSKHTDWQKRFNQSFVWQWLPLLILVVAVLVFTITKNIIRNTSSASSHQSDLNIDDTQADEMCHWFCDGLMFCSADVLKDKDQSIQVAVRSACYTGCRKHTGRLSQCSDLMQKGPVDSMAQCDAIRSCLQ